MTLTTLHVAGPRCGRADGDEAALLEHLRRGLGQAASEHGIRPDLIIVTGDLAENGRPGEYSRAVEFLGRLADLAGVPRQQVAIVPGSHDVNRALCSGYFITQEGLGEEPVPPYFPKWEPYRKAFEEFYAGVEAVTFTPDEPWTLFPMKDLGVVVAGLNSTMAETHLTRGGAGEVGGEQLTWFARQLAGYQALGWLRLAAHHHAQLSDWTALRQVLVAPGLVQLRVTGPPDALERYELLTLGEDGFTRYAGGERDRLSFTGPQPVIPPPAASATAFPQEVDAARDAYIAGGNIHIYNTPHDASQPPQDTFLDRVIEATRLRFPRATITGHHRGVCLYLRVSESQGTGAAEIRPVGVLGGPATAAALDRFVKDVHSQFAAADPGVGSELVYLGPAAPGELVRQARRQGVRLRSFVEYQGLLDLSPLARDQQDRLRADGVYPEALYVEQRFTVAGEGDDVRGGLIAQATDWLRADAARLIVVLGDFGRGKTSFLRQLTRRLPDELPDLTPVLVELRTLEKGPTLDDLLAQHLIRHRVEDVSKEKLRYMIDRGRIALLFDGFDELELRAGYDTAADYLQSLLNSIEGQAKVVLTSRTQHFRSTGQVQAAVRTALGERIETRAGSRVAILEDFTEDQILAFLVKLYHDDTERARRRFDLIAHISNLLDLTRNPRMLAFVAQLDDERLKRFEGEQLSAAGLYEEIIDYWLASEEDRQKHRRGLAALTKDERFAVCTDLALRLWRTMAPHISPTVLTDSVTATLARLTERGFTEAQAVHSIASGSLLVRTDDDAFQFVHQSVMEWLVAAHAARELKDSGVASALETRPMSRLMAAFFTDLADPVHARAWVTKILGNPKAPEATRRNALAIHTRMPGPQPRPDDSTSSPVRPPGRQDYSGLDLRTNDLNGLDLRAASLRGANLRGMRLSRVDLQDADLTRADLTGVVMTGGSLRGATLTGSRWAYAALLGTVFDGSPRELGYAAVAGQDEAAPVIGAAGDPVSCVAFSPDGVLLAYGSGRVVTIADATTGRAIRILRGHRAGVTAVAFSPEGRRIATASNDATAVVWDAATGTELIAVAGHRDAVTAVAWSPDGTRIATASWHSTADIWDSATGQHITTLMGHHGPVNAVAWSPDGTRIATASSDHTAGTWDPATGQHITTLTGHHSGVAAVAWSPDGTRIATASDDGTARIWDLATGQQHVTLTGHGKETDDAVLSPTQGFLPVTATVNAGLTDLAWSPDGTRIATASHDYTARTWDPATGQQHATLTGHRTTVTAVAWSPDGTRIATASWDNTARTWDPAIGTQLTTLTGHDFGVTAVAWSPDGTRIATASRDHTARTWDPATGQQHATLTGLDFGVTAVAWSPDGTRIATASWDNTARTWDPATGQQHATLTGHDHRVTAVAWSPDGTRIATASSDYTARTWDPATGTELTTLTGHRNIVAAVAWSPDGTRIATASWDNTARIWDPATGQQHATLTGHRDTVAAVAWSPDGTRIATASWDNTARIWDMTDAPRTSLVDRARRRRPTLDALLILYGHEAAVTHVAFSPSGALLATASSEGTVRMWAVADGTAVGTLAGHAGPVTSVAFSPDGAVLASASGDGTVRLWDLASPGNPATVLIPLPGNGYAVLLPDGSYKLHGDPGDRFWWALKLCRFAPGELDPYVPEIRRLPADAGILPARERSGSL